MKKSALLSVLVLALVFVFAGSAFAATWTNFDFLRFAKEKVLTDFHPTAKPDDPDTKSDYYQEPEEKDGIVSARVNIFYKGWFKQHSMLVQMDLRPNDGLIKVAVLQDSNGANLTGNKIFKENSWVELSSLDWK